MSTFSNTAREVEMPNGDIVKLHDAVTPNSTSNIKKFKYDDNGHVTESEAANATDLNLNSYATPTSGTTAIGTSDNVQTAIGKLDHQSHIDQTNILSVKDMVCDDAFSTSKSYAVGDITIYDNKLYKFKNAHQGAWSASDVDQISLSEQNSDFVVAEQNILSVQNKVGKNLLNPYTPDVTNYNTNRGITYTNNKDGTWYVAGTSTVNDAYIDLYQNQSVLPWGLKAGDVIKITTNSTKVNVAVIPIRSGGYGQTVAGNASIVGTLAITSDIIGMLVRFQVGESGTVTNENVIGMICREEAWNLSHDIELYGAPNSDLSALEAEDRAGLVECVDGGVKNIIDVNNYSNLDNVTISNGVFTTQGDTLTTLRFDVYLRNGSTQLLKAVNAQVISSNGVYQWEFVAPANTNNILIGHNGGTYNGRATINLTNLVAGQRYVIQVNVTQCQNASGAFKWQDVMICTKAAFGVSSKFVPYRPNWDLVYAAITRSNNHGLKKMVSFTASAANTYEIATDSKITVPANKMIRISATGMWRTSYCTGIKIQIGNDLRDNRTLAMNETTTAYNGLPVTATYYNDNTNDIDLYIAARTNSASASMLVIIYDIV